MNAEYSTIISYVLVALQNHPANQDRVLGYRGQFDLSLMNSAFFFFFYTKHCSLAPWNPWFLQHLWKKKTHGDTS